VPSPKFLPRDRSRLASSKTPAARDPKNPRKLLVDSARRTHLAAAGVGETLERTVDSATRRRNSREPGSAVPNAPSDHEIYRLPKRFPGCGPGAASGRLELADRCLAVRSADAVPTSACSGGDSTDEEIFKSVVDRTSQPNGDNRLQMTIVNSDLASFVWNLSFTIHRWNAGIIVHSSFR
jgi:hypothetical protein